MNRLADSATNPGPGAAAASSAEATFLPRAAAREAPPALSLHIERIVIQGLPLHAREGGRVASAFRAEMERLVAAGMPRSQRFVDHARPSLHLDAIRVGSGLDPARLGRELAEAVWRGVAR